MTLFSWNLGFPWGERQWGGEKKIQTQNVISGSAKCHEEKIK